MARIHIAAWSGNTGLLRSLVEGQPSLVNSEDERGRTPLHMAALIGHLETAEMLVSFGADPNATSRWQSTPLHHAVQWHCNPSVVELLIRSGANVNAKDKSQDTPLHVAAKHAHLDAVRALLARGADPNIRDRAGRTPLFVTAKYTYGAECNDAAIGIVRLLVEAGADAGVLSDTGEGGVARGTAAVETALSGLPSYVAEAIRTHCAPEAVERADPAERRPVTVTFVPQVPLNSDSVYLAGTFNGWDPGGICLGRADVLADSDSPGVGINLLDGDSVEYKYTRGTWETVETRADLSDIPNRRLDVSFGDTGSMIVSDVVEAWKDGGMHVR